MFALIAEKLSLRPEAVKAVIELLDQGATIPFIARYRKERTGALDEVQLGLIAQHLRELRELDARRQTILRTIEEQGQLTPELRNEIEHCWDATRLEDLYLPYKPHRKTRADKARELGLEPLAKQIMSQRLNAAALQTAVLNAKAQCKEKLTDEQVMQGARDIIAEWINLSQSARNAVRREFSYSAVISSHVVKTKAAEEGAQTYRDYFDTSDRLSRISSHRLLAMRRGEAEGYLRVDISPDTNKALEKLERIFIQGSNACSEQVQTALEDSYKRLLKPSIETEFAAEAKAKADEEAINIFASNARQLLLADPLGQRRVLALDPGFRTGCKTVCLSAQGDLLYHTVIYLHRPEEAEKTLLDLTKKFQTEAIAIGNGTASRETESLVRDILPQIDLFVVSESGASVYSASAVAREEFPDEDITVRGAVSIGRRLMDPLAELVKVDPKSIGVGQYQHDVDQTRLKQSLTDTVSSVVNHVGVDVNTASKHLLTYISGLGPTLAQNITSYRSANGPFPDRRSLLKVPKLGPKIFEQAAGFLRVSGSNNPLDNSAVHPERYKLVEQMARDLGASVEQLMNDANLRSRIDIQQYVSTEVGLPTLKDILQELAKPSRDPRQQATAFQFSDDVHTIEDLRPDMMLPGIVTNMTAFGAFVDLGVHQDGLIHISQVADRRVQSVQEVLHLGQQLMVRVLDVDLARKRISLTLRKGS